MASSSFHTRSISLPSTPNPIISNIHENLRSLSSSETSTSSLSLSNNLSMLIDLYNSVEGFLQMPTTQQFLIQDNHRSSIDELLNASLSLLDVCGVTKDVLSQTRQQVQEMQSTLRRKRDESEVAKEAEKYLALRKISKKALNKCLRDLKSKPSSSSSHDDTTLSTLERAEEVTFTLFESFLSTISGPKGQSKWYFMKKSSRVSCKEESSEFQTVDCLLHAIVKKNTVKYDAPNELRKFELSIQDLEDKLDGLMRCMIKSRVFLLNILTQ